MTKKPLRQRKLSIRREVVRQLEGVDLEQVRGGDSEPTCVTWKPGAAPTAVGCGPG